MPVELYLVRHGATKCNEERRLYGVEDVPLNELGRIQTEHLKKRLLAIHPDAVYSSPLCRAIDTVRGAAEQMGLPVLTDQRLCERDCGSMSFMLIKDMFNIVPPTQMELLRKNSALYSYGDAEPSELVQERMKNAIADICAANPEKKVCIATHAFALRMFLCFAQGKSIYDYFVKIPNCSLSKLIWDGTKYNVEFLGDDGHLPEKLKLNTDPAYVFARPEDY